jgi:hypothetical protein
MSTSKLKESKKVNSSSLGHIRKGKVMERSTVVGIGGGKDGWASRAQTVLGNGCYSWRIFAIVCLYKLVGYTAQKETLMPIVDSGGNYKVVALSLPEYVSWCDMLTAEKAVGQGTEHTWNHPTSCAILFKNPHFLIKSSLPKKKIGKDECDR